VFRLLLDEDSVSWPLVRALRARDVDVTTVQEQRTRSRADDDQLALAAELGRVLCSKNIRDFSRLHAEYLAAGRHHHGIVLISWQHYGIGEQLRRLLNLLAARTAEEMVDSLEYLSGWG
jgi:hypothetical protein